MSADAAYLAKGDPVGAIYPQGQLRGVSRPKVPRPPSKLPAVRCGWPRTGYVAQPNQRGAGAPESRGSQASLDDVPSGRADRLSDRRSHPVAGHRSGGAWPDSVQEPAGGILGCSTCSPGGALSRFHHLRAGDHALYLGIVHHHAVDDRGRAAQLRGAGRRKVGAGVARSRSTRYGTLALASFRAFGIAIAAGAQQGLVIDPGFDVPVLVTVGHLLVTGTMFLMWLGSRSPSAALGNGISIIIFAGYRRGSAFHRHRPGCSSSCSYRRVAPFTALRSVHGRRVTAVVVFVERGCARSS